MIDTEKEYRYMGHSLKYKEMEISGKEDAYRRPLSIKVARQSDATQITEESGVMTWTGGAFFDTFINAYIKDDDYDNLTEDYMLTLAKKLKLC